MISSYSKIHQAGHRETEGMKGQLVQIEEKIDGSQFSFMYDGEKVHFRSKNQQIYPDNPPKLFAKAVEYIKENTRDLCVNRVYRGECVTSNKHNTLEYARCPKGYVVIFDLEKSDGSCDYGNDLIRAYTCSYLFDVVPVLWRGKYEDVTSELIEELLDTESILGGTKIEGVVIKCYDKFDSKDKVLMCKYVSDRFKEKHRGNKFNPARSDILSAIGSQLRTEARWEKAIQHLREEGKLTETPMDIGNLIREIHEDVLEEEADWIKDKLLDHFWKNIIREVQRGFPEYYKKKLLLNTFRSEKAEAVDGRA
jgi:hypothetical protein